MVVDDSFNKQIFQNTIVKRLKAIRFEKWISLEELWKTLGIAHQYISNVLNGRQLASLDRLEKIAFWLWITPTDFEKLLKQARQAEYEHSTGQKVGDIDESKAVEVLLSKNGIKLSDDARAELERNIEFMRFKYPE